jgi:hypothetical protein
MGTNYGLNDSLQYFEYEFDGFDASGAYESTSASTDWPNFLLGRPVENIAAIKVLEVQIPYSFYLFTAENNTFTLTEQTATTPTNTTVTIAAGNYATSGTNNITSTLATAINAASVTAGNNNSYSVSYTIATQTLKISKTTNTSYTFTFTMGTAGDFGNNSPRLWLGFNGGSITSSLVSSSQVITSPNTINLGGPNYLYLNSYSLGSLCNLYLPTGSDPLPSGGLGPQMAKIPCTQTPGTIMYWQDPDPQKWFDVQNLNNFAQADFYFTMGNTIAQTPLRFNGNTFSIKLGILVNARAKTNLTGGGFNNDRVIKRVRIG